MSISPPGEALSSIVSTPMIDFVLASASPRRRDLLLQIAATPAVIDPADVDESPLPGETPARYAVRVTHDKVAQVATRHPSRFILAADTVVACGRRILPKAEDEGSARQCLELLSGRRHRVHGGLVLRAPDGSVAVRHVETSVVFKRLTQREIDWYLASGEWRGKAGGYAIQGLAARFVREVIGSFSNVVGLPLFETTQLLTGAGLIRPGGP